MAHLDELLVRWHEPEVAPFVVRQGQLAREQEQAQEELVPHGLRLPPRVRVRCEHPGWKNGQHSEYSTKCHENILQAQSKSAYEVSITIHVEVLYTMTLENNIPRFEKRNAVSDGHVLQLYLNNRHCD